SDCSAIGHTNRDSPAPLAGVEADYGNEGLGRETHARQVPLVECRSNLFATNPRRAKFLEWRFRSTSDRDSRVLQNLKAGIQNGTLRRSQIRRRRNPLCAGALEEIIAMPLLHRDDMEIAPDMVLSVEQLRELADREAIADRQWIVGGEAGFVGVE